MAAIEPANILALLKRIHLFRGISDDVLQELAEKFSVEYYADGGKVFGVGEDADKFYILYRGEIALTRPKGKRPFAYLAPGDYFGHTGVIHRHYHNMQAVAGRGTALLTLPAKTFVQLYNASVHLKKSIRMREHTDALLRRIKFDWLHEKETVYVVATKHVLFLYQALIGPFAALTLAVLLITLYVVSGSSIPLALGALGVLASIGWAVWQWIDWGNDYYIITNQRIVWIEKVLFLYDSRIESPFAMINNTDVHTDILGRWMDYGEVTIKTYTTRIDFHHIPSPSQVAALIDELRGRVAKDIKLSEEKAMTEAIKRHLGLIQPQRNKVNEEAEQTPMPQGLGLSGILLKTLFQMRTVEGDAIIYRKHWFVLIREAWAPTSLLVLLAGLMTLDILYTPPEQGKTTYLVILLTIFFGVSIWWIYRFIDWRNDRFELTSEQIVDVDKKPLGNENRKTAKLEDILSIEYRRERLSGLILNFGTVYIKVGTEVFTFDNVHDPTRVQQEIQQRRQERLSKVREDKIKAERDRLAKWMAIYHKSAEEIRQLEEEKNDKLPPETG